MFRCRRFYKFGIKSFKRKWGKWTYMYFLLFTACGLCVAIHWTDGRVEVARPIPPRPVPKSGATLYDIQRSANAAVWDLQSPGVESKGDGVKSDVQASSVKVTVKALLRYITTNATAAAIVLQSLRTNVTTRPPDTAKPTLSIVIAKPVVNAAPVFVDVEAKPVVNANPTPFNGEVKAAVNANPVVLDVEAKPLVNANPVLSDTEAKSLRNANHVLTNVEVKPVDNANPFITNIEAKPAVNANPVLTNVDAKPVVNTNPALTNIEAKPVVNANPALTNVAANPVVNANPALTNVAAKPVVNPNPALTNVAANPVANANPALTNVEAKPVVNANPALTNVAANPVVNANPVLTNVEAKPVVNTNPVITNVAANPVVVNPNHALTNVDTNPVVNANPALTNVEANPIVNANPALTNVEAKPVVNANPALTNVAAKPVVNANPALTNVAANPVVNANPALTNVAAKPVVNANPALTNVEVKPVVDANPVLFDVKANPVANENTVLLKVEAKPVVNTNPVLTNIEPKPVANVIPVPLDVEAKPTVNVKPAIVNATAEAIANAKYAVLNIAMQPIANTEVAKGPAAVKVSDSSVGKDITVSTSVMTKGTEPSTDSDILKTKMLATLSRIKPIPAQSLAQVLQKTRNNFTREHVNSSVTSPVFMDLMQEKLPAFDPKFKNPCWMDTSNPTNKTLRCLPYVFIIGVKKCGTTSLFSMIRRHPHFADPKFKEAQWFPRTRFEPGQDDINHYVDMFSRASLHITAKGKKADISRHPRNPVITGEASPANLHLNMMWRFIKGNTSPDEPTFVNLDYIHHFLPAARMVVIFRDPVERLYSDYYHEYGRLLDYPGVGPAHFHEVVTLGLSLYRDCLQHHTLRACVYNETILDATRIQIQLGMYSVFWEELTRLYPREQIKVLHMEKFVKNVKGTVLDVFLFLKMRRPRHVEWRRIMARYNKNERPSSYTSRGDMMSETRTLLKDLYRPFNQRMAQLTNDKEFFYGY